MAKQIDLAIAQLSNNLPQVFSIGEQHQIYTSWLAGPQEGALWTPWQRFPGRLKVITAASLSDGRAFLLGIGPDDDSLWANWKVSTDPDDAWSGWSAFASPGLSDIVAVPLSGGPLQLFGVAPDHSVYTCWETGENPELAWSPWQPFPGTLKKLAAANLSDGRPQLFAAAPDGTILSMWKTTTELGAPWSDWTEMGLASCRELTAFPLTDGALQLLTCQVNGPGQTRWKVSGDPDDAWSDWQSFGDHTYLQAVSSGKLPDGRPLLFGIGADGALTYNFKKDKNSAAAWRGWRPFIANDVPPGPMSCTVTMESIQINSTRSLFKDTVFVSASLAIGQLAPQAVTSSLGKLGNGQVSLNLAFDPITLSDTDTAVLTYAVVNNGHSDPGVVVQQLENATKKLAQKGADALATAAGGAIGAALGASIGTAAIPILGTALGALAGWVVDTVGGALFANCDGTVAAGVHTITGKDMRQKGFDRQYDYTEGTDSPTGCGDHSIYVVTWTADAN